MPSPLDPLLTPIGVSATAAAAAVNAVTLPGVAGKTTYLRGLLISAAAVVAIVGGVVTITGLAGFGGTLSIQISMMVASGMLVPVQFSDPLPASAVNTPIVITLPAIVGGGASAVVAWGFQYG